MKSVHAKPTWPVISFLTLTACLFVAGAMAQEAPAKKAVDPFVDDPPATAKHQAENGNSETLRLARGLRMKSDGALAGQVTYIDESTLLLHPVADALVTFVQNRVVIAQQRTGPKGEFEAPGLTPSAVYSVFVSHKNWFAATSVVTIPVKVQNGVETAAARKDPVNRIGLLVAQQGGVRMPVKLTAATRARLDQQPGYADIDVHEIQMVPREDFVAALQTGALGNDLGLAILGTYGTSSGVGGGVGGGGLGSLAGAAGAAGVGGGGGGIAGAGAGAAGAAGGAAGALGAAGAVAGGSSSTQNQTNSSPFLP